MEVKCILCDKIEILDDNTPLAKKLRNRPIHTFMCDGCRERIAEKTKKHLANPSFKLYHHWKKKKKF